MYSGGFHVPDVGHLLYVGATVGGVPSPDRAGVGGYDNDVFVGNVG